MKLEDQVCSLELAKKLKRLGVKQDSLFWWINHKNSPFEDYHLISDEWAIHAGFERNEKYAAYTVAELGEMLPERYLSGKALCDDGAPWNCWCFDEMWSIENYNEYRTYTEVEARAKMLIHLLENNLIKVQ